MKELTFRDFMMELDGGKLDDRACLDILFYQPDRIYKQSGKPIATSIRKLVDGYVINIYAMIGDDYYLFEYATKPCFAEVIPENSISDRAGQTIYSVFRKTKLTTREELAKTKRFIESDCSGIAHTQTVFPNSKDEDTKMIIDGCYEMWTRMIPDVVLREQSMSV